MVSWIGTGSAIAFTLVGMAASAVLLQHHVAIATGSDPILAAVCESTESASCDEVLSSEWGKLFGQPTALWGFCFFAALFAWYLLVGITRGRMHILNLLPLIATLFGGIGCAVLAFIMYVKLPKWCPLCAVMHVSTWSLLILSIIFWRIARRSHRRNVLAEAGPEPNGRRADAGWFPRHPAGPRFRHVVGAIALALSGSLAAWANYHRSVQTDIARAYRDHWAERERLLSRLDEVEQESQGLRERWEEYHREYAAVYRQFVNQDVVDIPLSPDVPVRGNPDAPNTVILFSDVLCPYCAGVEKLLNEQIEQFPDALRVIWKHFPLDKDCNAKLNRTLHAGACEAAWTVEAARMMGGDNAYWAMLDDLMDHRKEFAKNAQQIVNASADKIGLDQQTLWRTIRGSDARERVDRNIAEGQTLGLRSTPVVYLNGRQVKQFGDRHFWRFALRDAKDLKISTQPSRTQPATEPGPDHGKFEAGTATTVSSAANHEVAPQPDSMRPLRAGRSDGWAAEPALRYDPAGG